jgi:hypothetical protein
MNATNYNIYEDSDPHFTAESGETCEHSAPICRECEEEKIRATVADLLSAELSDLGRMLKELR